MTSTIKITIERITKVFYFILGIILLISGIISVLEKPFSFTFNKAILLIFAIGITIVSILTKKKSITCYKNGIVYFDGRYKKEYLDEYLFQISTYEVTFKDRSLFQILQKEVHSIVIYDKNTKKKLKSDTNIELIEVNNKKVKSLYKYLIEYDIYYKK